MSLFEEAYTNEAENTDVYSDYPDNDPLGSDEGRDSGYRFSMPNFSFLAAPTGDGAVEAYIDHPLNFDGKKSTARILRGCTGICGTLNYGLIDIALGLVEKIQENKKAAAEAPEHKWTEKEINNAY